MNKKILNQEQLNELKNFDTPTICNAIESFNKRPKTEGFFKPGIKPILNYGEPIVGYAVTAKISSIRSATESNKKLIMPYLKKIREYQISTISVIEDIDWAPIGSFWGEVNASIHMALGCKGVVTNGGVRDLSGVKEIGFAFFAKEILVSHAYVHLIEADCPVRVEGFTIRPGDLIHADENGITSIPSEIAFKLADACREVQEAEGPVIKACKKVIEKGEKIDIDYLMELRKEMYKRRDRNRF